MSDKLKAKAMLDYTNNEARKSQVTLALLIERGFLRLQSEPHGFGLLSLQASIAFNKARLDRRDLKYQGLKGARYLR